MSAFSSFLSRAIAWLARQARRVGAIAWRALIKYDETDGEQRAASFAYYAFFAVFPLLLLIITIGSNFVSDEERVVTDVLGYVQNYVPMDIDGVDAVLRTVHGVVKSRRSAGTIAFFVLAWSAIRFFHALVRGVNRAWGTKEYSWWRLPIKNCFMLAILCSALFLGIIAPAVLRQIEIFYWAHSRDFGLSFGFLGYLFQLGQLAIPLLVLFYGMSMFYKFAPRRRTSFREVWSAAVFVTVSLELLQRLFVLYTRNIGNFNALYGTFGSVVALLMWIYLSGSIIILGGCICAARYEIDLSLADAARET
jgi:Ca2+-transporting ATPase